MKSVKEINLHQKELRSIADLKEVSSFNIPRAYR